MFLVFEGEFINIAFEAKELSNIEQTFKMISENKLGFPRSLEIYNNFLRVKIIFRNSYIHGNDEYKNNLIIFLVFKVLSPSQILLSIVDRQMLNR